MFTNVRSALRAEAEKLSGEAGFTRAYQLTMEYEAQLGIYSTMGMESMVEADYDLFMDASNLYLEQLHDELSMESLASIGRKIWATISAMVDKVVAFFKKLFGIKSAAEVAKEKYDRSYNEGMNQPVTLTLYSEMLYGDSSAPKLTDVSTLAGICKALTNPSKEVAIAAGFGGVMRTYNESHIQHFLDTKRTKTQAEAEAIEMCSELIAELATGMGFTDVRNIGGLEHYMYPNSNVGFRVFVTRGGYARVSTFGTSLSKEVALDANYMTGLRDIMTSFKPPRLNEEPVNMREMLKSYMPVNGDSETLVHAKNALGAFHLAVYNSHTSMLRVVRQLVDDVINAVSDVLFYAGKASERNAERAAKKANSTGEK